MHCQRSGYCEDYLAACVAGLNVASSRSHVSECARLVQHRCELAILDEPGQGEQVLLIRLGRGKLDAVTHKAVDDRRFRHSADRADNAPG